MKDESRIFAPAMVRALWDGHKLETRRMLSPRNTYFDGGPWPKGAKLDDFDFEAATIDYGSSPNRACGPLLKVARRGADTVHRIVERTA
ncbi:hypothetical protein G3W52_30385, partial [Escherichia coli]|nr:hypothetical protein [Escherichia coli]